MHGDSLQHYLVAVVVPDMAQAKAYATEHALVNEEAALSEAGFKGCVLSAMDSKAKEQNLTSLEKIKRVYLTSQPFTVENDLITPTFKIKRNIARKAFAEQIAAMYAEPE